MLLRAADFALSPTSTAPAARALPAGSAAQVEEASPWRWARFTLVLALHGLLLLFLWQVQQRPEPEPEPIRMAVRVIERSAPAPEAEPEPRPQVPEVPPAPVPPPPVRPPEPRPVAVPEPVARPAPRVAATVPPAPTPAEVVEPRDAAPPAPAVTAVRFDAAYLNNPAPVYPRASRRRGEQGRVLLQVQVNARGLPEQVDIHEGSGYARLDAAALEAVRGWRFVPARRGGEAIAASVLVPILFQME